MPIGYSPKVPKISGTEDVLSEVTTLQVLGLEGLVFDEIEKTDWKIITPSEFSVKGKEPLSIGNNVLEFGMKIPNSLLEIGTNYGALPVVFGNTTVSYQYAKQDIELDPLDEVRLLINIKESERQETPTFFQYGELEFVLTIGDLPIKRHSINFFVIDPSINKNKEV